MDGPSGHYASKLNKSDRQRKYDFTCMHLKKQNKGTNKTKEKQTQT